MKNIKLRALFSSKRPERLAVTSAAVLVLAFVAAIAGAVLPVSAATGINKTISFQGKVVNSNGTNVADGTYTFRFRIYSSTYPTDATNACSANSCMWEETKNLTTVNGIFQTYLGDTTALPGSVDFNSDSLYLGVLFNGDTEMNPRIQLSAVPYAFNAMKLNGLDATNFVQLSPGSQQSGFINVSGNITTAGTFQGTALDPATANAINIGANNATAINIGKTAGGTATKVNGTFLAKTVTGYDSQTAFQIQDSYGNVLFDADTSSTRIGIGTAAPTYGLDVNNDIGVAGNIHLYNGFGQTNHTIDIATNASGAGYALTVKGGDAGSGNTNGGNLLLTGGAGHGTGARGVVQIDTPVFTTNTDTACATNCTISQSLVDGGGAVIVSASNPNLTITMPVPTNNVAGRIVYITGGTGSQDFTLEFNSGASKVDVAMKQNTSATLVWSGSAWSAAGASSSTTLQAAYNNTLASAGGAEIVLNNTATANGLTIRNAQSNPIIGPVFEVQSSIGTDLMAVNSNATEYASNGGAEDTATFGSNWVAVGGGTADQWNYTSDATYVATGQDSVRVQTAAATSAGVRNNFSSNLPAGATTYQVSFTGKLDSAAPAFDPNPANNSQLEVVYSPDGGTTMSQTCTSYSTRVLVSTSWTKVTCTFTSTASASNSQLYIRQTDAVNRKFYIDNLSVTRNDSSSTPANLQVGGGSLGGNITLFTLDRSSSPPVAAGNQTLFGSMYYDTTSGRIQCYQANGWGACGSAPDTYVNLSPEYPGAVLAGPGGTSTASTGTTGVGTMTAEFCSNMANVLVTANYSLCNSGQAINYYHWTSPQPTQQTYSIYVSYQLPGGFKKFQSDSTVQLTARVDNTSNADVTFEMFRSQGGTLSQCGSATDIITQGGTQPATANSWITYGINGAESTGCGFDTSSANSFVIYKINMKANSNANAYVGALSFTITNQ